MTAPEQSYRVEPKLQWLDLIGFGLSNDPEYPACIPPFAPLEGTQVATRVVVSREGDEWIARPADAASGTVLLRFHVVNSSLLGQAVAGTLQGWAHNERPFGIEPPRSVRVDVAGLEPGRGASIEGTIPPGVSFVLGSASGWIRFSGRATGDFATCEKVQWTLQPLEGI